MDFLSFIVLLIILTVAIGWLFFSDKIVRFFGWEDKDSNSWLFPAKK